MSHMKKTLHMLVVTGIVNTVSNDLPEHWIKMFLWKSSLGGSSFWTYIKECLAMFSSKILRSLLYLIYKTLTMAVKLTFKKGRVFIHFLNTLNLIGWQLRFSKETHLSYKRKILVHIFPLVTPTLLISMELTNRKMLVLKTYISVILYH